MSRPSVARLVVLGIVVSGVGSVAAAGIPAPANVAIVPTQAKDTATWTMPLDGYVRPASVELDTAQDLLIGRCLAGRPGNEYVVPWRDVAAAARADDLWDADRSGNDAPPLASTRPLDAATAATRGYHGASRVDPGAAAWSAWRPTVVAADIDACSAQTRIAGTASLDAQQNASDVALHRTLIAAVTAREDPAVLAAARGWHSCMVEGDASTLTDVPAEMTPAVRSRFLLSDPTSAVTRDETTLATLDLGCQRSSGYRAALYDAEWSRLLHVTAADAASLRTGSRAMGALTGRLDRIIARNLPERPAAGE